MSEKMMNKCGGGDRAGPGDGGVDTAYVPVPVGYYNRGNDTLFAEKLKGEGDVYQLAECEQLSPMHPVMKTSVHLKHIILGSDAIDGELQCIEVTTKSGKQQEITFPIAYLQAPHKMQLTADVLFTEIFTFRLAKGKGPVYLVGTFREVENNEEFLEEEDEEDCDNDEGEVVGEEEDEEDANDIEDEEKENGEVAAAAAKEKAAAEENNGPRKRKGISKLATSAPTKKLKGDAEDKKELMEEN